MSNPIANATGNVYYSKISGTTDYLFTNADPKFDEQVITNITASEFNAPFLESGPAKGSRVARLTAVLGAEKVTNGTFTGSAAGWTVAVNWAYGTNNIVHTAGVVGQLEQDVTAVSGETYVVVYTISNYIAGTLQATVGGVSGLIRNRNGTFTEQITATGTGNLILLASVDGDFTVDTVSVKKLATGIIGSKVIDSVNLSTRDAITVWLRSSVNVASGEMQFLLDNTALCASPLETFNIPTLVANEWTRVIFRLSAPEDDTAIISIGVKVIGNNVTSALGAYTLDIYQPRIFDEFEGRTAFTITQNVELLDETDYQSLAIKEFAPSVSMWTVTLEGHKEGPPPLLKGQSYLFGFVESNSVGQAFVGQGFYSGFTPAGTFSEFVQYPYTIQGVSFLHQPTQ